MDITLQTLAALVLKNKISSVPVSPIQAAVPEPVLEKVEALEPEELKVNISLIRTPNSGMKGLVRLRQCLGLEMPIGELLGKAQHLPMVLLEGVSLSQYQERCTVAYEEEGCIEITVTTTGERLNLPVK